MSKYYLSRSIHNSVPGDINLLLGLQRNIPGVELESAVIVTVPDDLDKLILLLGGIPLTVPLYEATINPLPAAQSAPKKPEKKIRRAPPTGICSQCKADRPLTKEGICKPCAMRNAKAARKNGKTSAPEGHVGSQEKIVNRQAATTDTEQRFLTRHGPILGKKLG